MKYLLPFAALIIASPAFAQGTITVIQDDGTVEVLDLGQPAVDEPDAVPEEAVSAPSVPSAPPVEEIPPIPSPVPTDVISAPKSVISTVPVEEGEQEEAAPPPVAKPKPAKKPEKKPEVKKSSADSRTKQITPARKPLRQTLPEGVEITPERALYIALDEAPPASRNVVEEKVFEGTDVYAVTFSSENGPYEVLVNKETGVILRSGYVDVEQAPVLPGHLPRY